MKRVAIIMTVLVVAVVAGLTLLSLRDQPLAYNPANETTLAGSVQEVQEYYCPLAEDRGTHLRLKTDNGDFMIHVGLARFLRRQNIVFGAGDKVEVLGSRIKGDTVIARQLIRGGDTYIVRDPSGKPLWQ